MAAKKVTNSVVNSVISGTYGNGTARKNALTKAGYDYNEVQNAVNKALGATTKNSSTKSKTNTSSTKPKTNTSSTKTNNSSSGNGVSPSREAVNAIKNAIKNSYNAAQNAAQNVQQKTADMIAEKQAEAQRQQQINELQEQYQYTPSVDFMGVYNDYADGLKNILQQQKNALEQQKTSRARSAYVASEQNKTEIPRILSNAGVTGGLAEKIRANQNTSYQQNLAGILSDTATQGAELERNNANLISNAYREAMSNQQAADNERALAQQQYANQLALLQQQQEYERQQANQDAADSIASDALGRVSGDIYKKVNGKNKLVSSEANQISSIYNTAKTSGASQSTLNQLETAMVAAAQQRYEEKYGGKKNPSMTEAEYLQRYVYDRINK